MATKPAVAAPKQPTCRQDSSRYDHTSHSIGPTNHEANHVHPVAECSTAHVCLLHAHIMVSTSALTDRVTLWSCEQADTVARELLPLKRALKVKTFWDSATDLQRAELLSLSLSCLRTHAARHSQLPGTLRLFDAYLLFSLPCACNQLDHTNLQHCVLAHSLMCLLRGSGTHSPASLQDFLVWQQCMLRAQECLLM